MTRFLFLLTPLRLGYSEIQKWDQCQFKCLELMKGSSTVELLATKVGNCNNVLFNGVDVCPSFNSEHLC